MEKKKIAVIMCFVAALFLVSSAYACESPIIYGEEGSPINPLGGYLFIYGSKYPGESANYKFKINNTNDRGMTVFFKPDSNLKNYISEKADTISAKTTKEVTLNVWVNGHSTNGYLYVYFKCDGAVSWNYMTFYIQTYIFGKNKSPPPYVTCNSNSGLNGCYSGIEYISYCDGNELKYLSGCSKSCCEKYKGEDALCSLDGASCMTIDNIPPGKKGNIAFLCKDDKCKYGKEKDLIVYLKLDDWNVTAKKYDKWTEDDLKNYDIITCYDQGSACKIKFNSPVYNAHVEMGKPFLEIPNTNSGKAAYSFEYTTKYGGTYGSDDVKLYDDCITNGIPASGFSPVGGAKLAGIDQKYITNDVKTIVSVKNRNNEISDVFKVDNATNHGRFAFVGWFYKADVSQMSSDAGKLLDNMLTWLKCGNSCFGGSDSNLEKKGEIAFICGSRYCVDTKEVRTIKWFRENGYGVTAKEMKYWNQTELYSYNAMVCSKNCRFDKNSSFYKAYMGGVGFLELPMSSIAYAANAFNYSSLKGGASRSSVNITLINYNPLLPDGSQTQIFSKKRSMYGISTASLLTNATDVANIQGTSYSVMFRSADSVSDGRGRYVFMGWFNYLGDLTEFGNNLSLKAIDWVVKRI